MYSIVKNIIKNLVPRGFLRRNEFFFRKLAALPYNGNNYECNICHVKLRKFVVQNDDLLCPACGSLSRTRQLWDFLNDQSFIKGKVLHFSPSSILNRKFSKISSIHYTSTDYENEFEADQKYDITNLPIANESFDLIICYHVLEHIENDRKAMAELYRVLQPNGNLLIQTPFKDGDIYEDPAMTTQNDRLIAYGQKDHVRIYSIEGLIARFKKINPNSSSRIIHRLPDHTKGMLEDRLILVNKLAQTVTISNKQ